MAETSKRGGNISAVPTPTGRGLAKHDAARDSTGIVVPARFRGTAADQRDMVVLGRKQVLRRNFRFTTILGFASTGQYTLSNPQAGHCTRIWLILSSPGGLGDVACTLSLCITRWRHCHRFLVFDRRCHWDDVCVQFAGRNGFDVCVQHFGIVEIILIQFATRFPTAGGKFAFAVLLSTNMLTFM
jgi:hypothetical protein